MANSGAVSKVDTVVKLALISFVVILSFAVGTFVGKQVSDADYRRAELENDYQSEKATERVVASADASTPEPQAISDAEVQALREEFERAEAGSTAKKDHKEHAEAPAEHKEAATHLEGYKKIGDAKTDAAHEVATAPATSAAASPVAAPAERVAKALAPAKDVPEKRKPSTALPSVATSAIGKYTVQVASYATENEAREQVAKLKEKGFGAFYVNADIKGQTWYRVSIGLFADQASAMDYRKEILDSKSVYSAIVQKIVR